MQSILFIFSSFLGYWKCMWNFPDLISKLEALKSWDLINFFLYCYRSIAFKSVRNATATKEKTKVAHRIYQQSNLWTGEKVHLPEISVASWSWWNRRIVGIIECSGKSKSNGTRNCPLLIWYLLLSSRSLLGSRIVVRSSSAIWRSERKTKKQSTCSPSLRTKPS